MQVEHLSLVTTPILLLKGYELVSQGTGFYYGLNLEAGGAILFLVTNHHVLTGYSPKEDKPTKGDNIVFYLHKEADNPGNTKEIRTPIFTKTNKPKRLTGTLEAEQGLVFRK